MPINASKSEIYESYLMESPSGEFMCYCNKKKAFWYINKNLAKWVGDKKFQLFFEPNGKGKADIPFYTKIMKNCCVVCGSDKDLNKHHVVPYVFRSRFPLEDKESNHHDILATCIDCHEEYEAEAMNLKKEIAKEMGISMKCAMSPEQVKNRKILSAQNVIQKINSGEIIGVPDEKLEVLRQKALQPLAKEPTHNGTAWADEIVAKILSQNQMFEFAQRWRKHFVDIMKPKYLPEHWSIDSALEKSGRFKK